MSKALTRLTLALLAAAVCARAASAQTTLEWIVLSPASEGFAVRMPKQPASTPQRVLARGIDASGHRYDSAEDDVTTFVVWSMKGSHRSGPLGGGDRAIKTSYGVSPFLDEVAELAWELLVTPELERLGRKGDAGRRAAEMRIGMTYVREFEVSGLPAREYSVKLENRVGHVYLCSEGAQVYVVAALGLYAGDARLREFVDSFVLKSSPAPRVGGGDPTPGAGTGTGRGATVGVPDAPVDYSRPFRQAEVTKKAGITFKPEPGYTEEARRFNVTGTVRLRTILHASGAVQAIVVVKGLPHGLTEKAVAALRQVRFQPALKDGRPVSQYAVFEYHFNIY